MTLPLGLALVASLGLSAGAQSLADLAKKTQEDREKSKAPAAKVITNDDLKPGRVPSDQPAADAQKSAEILKKETPAVDAKPETKTDAPAVKDTKGEAYWQGRYTALDAKLTEAIAKESALNDQMRTLMAQIADASGADRGNLLDDRTRLADDLKAARDAVAANRAAMTALEEEGRKAGADPKWLR
jgi:hypothetical protein